MALKISIKEKKLYSALRGAGVSTPKAHREVAAVGKPKKAKPGHYLATPTTASTGKVKKI